MSDIVVVTSQDLASQAVRAHALENIVEEVVNNPTDAIDPRILALMREMQAPSYKIEYENVQVLSRQDPAYPNPTLNHFALGRFLGRTQPDAKKFIDLGCGTGFLGNYAGKHLDCEEIIFADMNPNAINQSLFSYGDNNGVDLQNCPIERYDFGVKIKVGKDKTVDGRIGDVNQTMYGFDAEGCIAACAPMYIPDVCEVWPQAFITFGAVAQHIGADLYVGHSNLSNHMLEDAAGKLGMKLECRNEAEVPFVAEYADFHRRGIVEESLTAKGLRVDREGKAYHKLMVSKLYK